MRLLLLLVLCSGATAQSCPLIDTTRVPKPAWELGGRNCTFFNTKACCTGREVSLALGPSMKQAGLLLDGVDIDPEFLHLQCRNHLDYLMCFFCSPLQQGWVDTNGKVLACLGFCNRVFRSCKEAFWRGQRLNELFANGTALCEAQNFKVLDLSFMWEMSGKSEKDFPGGKFPTQDGFDALSLAGANTGSCFGITTDHNQMVGDGRALRSNATLGMLAALFCSVLLSHSRLGCGVGRWLLVCVLLMMLSKQCDAATMSSAAAQDTGAVAGLTGTCPFYNFRAPTPQWGLTNCTWFKPSSCCLPHEEKSLAAEIDRTSAILYDTSPQCQQALNFLGCWPCHPEQGSFYDALQQRLTVCERFCTHMHTSCMGAMWNGKPVQQAFSDSAAFCRGLKLDIGQCEANSSSPRALKGCLDLTDNFFMADKWCELPVAADKSTAARVGAGPQTLALALVVMLSARGGVEDWGLARPRVWSSKIIRVALCLICTASVAYGSPIPATTVEQWANAIGEDMIVLSKSAMQTTEAQRIYSNANYQVNQMNASARVVDLGQKLNSWFRKKQEAVLKLQAQVEKDVHAMLDGQTEFATRPVPEFIDIRSHALNMPALAYDERYKQNVTHEVSGVSLPQGVYQRTCGSIACSGDLASMPQDARAHIELSDKLESRVFNNNAANDPGSLRWQYVGFQSGVMRKFPTALGRSNHFGVPIDYDPRVRPWYVSAASGPKDVVIIIDCSASMRLKGRFIRAKAAAKLVLSTLSKKDYVSVICARGPYKCNCRSCDTCSATADQSKVFCPEVCDDCPAETKTLGCVPDVLLPGTPSVVNDLSERLEDMQAGGSKDLLHATKMAASLLAGNQRAGCQSLILFFTDGLDHTPGARCMEAWWECNDDSCYCSEKGTGHWCPEDWGGIERLVGNEDGEFDSKNVPSVLLFNVIERGHECNRDHHSRQIPNTTLSFHCNWTDTFLPEFHQRPFSSRFCSFRYDRARCIDANHYVSRVACAGRGSYAVLKDTRDLAGQMQVYFNLVLSSTHARGVSWTAPYVDSSGLGLVLTASAPVYDASGQELIAVVGVDAALDEIEVMLRDARWGDVSTFLISGTGETMIHPLLSPVRDLLNGPVFPDIEKVEMFDGEPAAFKDVREAMLRGESGQKTIMRRKAIPLGSRDSGLSFVNVESTYFYGAVPGLDFAYAFVLSSSDLNYRRVAPTHAVHDPASASYTGASYFHRFQDYNNITAFPDNTPAGPVAQLNLQASQHIPGDFISNTHSSFKVTPSSFCDPLKYQALEDAGDLTKAVHDSVNGPTSADNLACSMNGALLRPWAVTDVKLTRMLQEHWLKRTAANVTDVVWTYVATPSGIFRSFPGHQSQKMYDPTIRPWYYKGIHGNGVPTVSTPYLDASGSGKVVTLVQAVFEGTPSASPATCDTKVAGCTCAVGEATGAAATGPVPVTTCESRYCFEGRCSQDRIAAVLGVDFKYKTFEQRVVAHTTRAPDVNSGRHCHSRYYCNEDLPIGQRDCMTECYLLDDTARVVMHYTLGEANDEEEVDYHEISLGEVEGELTRRLNAAGLLTQQEYYDYQGVCYRTPPREIKASIVAPSRSVQAEDDLSKFGGPFPVFSNKHSCQKHVVVHKLKWNDTSLSKTGTFNGPCNSGSWTLARVPNTKLFLLVIDERLDNPIQRVDNSPLNPTFSVSCHVSNTIHKPGAFQTLSGTCSLVIDKDKSKLIPAEQCVHLETLDMPCKVVSGATFAVPLPCRLLGALMLLVSAICAVPTH
jgi:hypothetical protein